MLDLHSLNMVRWSLLIWKIFFTDMLGLLLKAGRAAGSLQDWNKRGDGTKPFQA
jgi:hypothetical protein